jgi:menaquinone-9 beta-reductase
LLKGASMSQLTTPAIGRARHYDAVVVGARPAGAATAMLLARAGRRVLLLDRSAYGTDTLSTHALMRAGVLQLRRWRLLENVRRAMTPAVSRTVFHYGDETVDVSFRPQHGVDALYAPRRTVLDRIVVDAARAAGVEVVYGARVTGLQRDATGRVVGVRARTATEPLAVAGASIVIGADGMRSTIARLVEAEIEHSTTAASAFIYGYFRGLGVNGYDWHFRPGTSAGVIPTNHGVANVFVGMPPRRFTTEVRARGVEATFRAVLAEAAPPVADALAGHGAVGRFRSFAGHAGFLRRSHGPGWALVGDAGYFKDPVTAHGITDALRDAELLARALLSSPAHAPDATAFQAARDALARPFMDATAGIAAYTWNLAQVQALHLELKRATDEEVAILLGLDQPLGIAV